jgi:hypothetical protein
MKHTVVEIVNILDNVTISVIQLRREGGRSGALLKPHEAFLAFKGLGVQLSTLGDQVNTSFVPL